MKNILVWILALLVIIFGYQTFSLNKKLNSVLEQCGDTCKDMVVNIKTPGVAKAAEVAGVSKSQLLACMESNQKTARVNTDFDDAIALGLTGTPASFLVNHEKNLSVFIAGAYPIELLNEAKAKLLAEDVKDGDVVYADPARGINMVVAQAPEQIQLNEDENRMGTNEPKIRLIEYSDFDCPYCKVFFETVEQFIAQNNDVEFVYRHYPLRQIHPDAQKKSEASECVKELAGNDAFWKFTKNLYETAESY